MFQLELSKDDQDWLLGRYPGLALSKEKGIQVVSGDFEFSALHDGLEIKDNYKIRIELQGNQVSNLPIVTEIGSRIKSIADERKIPLVDLHTYDDSTACLCLKFEEAKYFPDGFSFPIFIEKLVVPFFYAQRYFEDFDSWPWDTYSHGLLGWFEWFFDKEDVPQEKVHAFLQSLKSTRYWEPIRILLLERGGIKGHHKCICGSSLRYRDCHSSVFRGMWKLKNLSNEYGIEI